MLIYASLADYLESQLCLDDSPSLRGRDRPILVLEEGETLTRDYQVLMQVNETLYEVGFPWIQIEDWEKQKHSSQEFCLEFNLETNHGSLITFTLFDEVLDETQISNDENKAQHLKKQLKDRFERNTAETIAIFISLFDRLLGDQKQRSQAECFLLNIPRILNQSSREDARLPLVLALNQRYQLRHKLELIAPKLRSQLNRTAEMMKLGSIQEMDAYCLRDYVRRPRQNAIEKAGSRQELMGIKRYQNFNTPENRFLKGFCNYLHLECLEYKERYDEAKRLGRAIDRFRQEPSVQAIPNTQNFAGKPNYVLQQNPIYRSFYQAYLDYLKRRTEKEKIWGFRQALLADTVQVLLIAALLNLEGSYIDPAARINILSVPKAGRYLPSSNKQLVKVHIFLQTQVLTFTIIRLTNPGSGDLELQLQIQDLDQNLVKEEVLKIWIFWYEPTANILQSINKVTSNLSLCLYLYKRPNLSEQINETSLDNENVKTLLIPNPIEEDLEAGMECFTDYLCQWCGRLIS